MRRESASTVRRRSTASLAGMPRWSSRFRSQSKYSAGLSSGEYGGSEPAASPAGPGPASRSLGAGSPANARRSHGSSRTRRLPATRAHDSAITRSRASPSPPHRRAAPPAARHGVEHRRLRRHPLQHRRVVGEWLAGDLRGLDVCLVVLAQPKPLPAQLQAKVRTGATSTRFGGHAPSLQKGNVYCPDTRGWLRSAPALLMTSRLVHASRCGTCHVSGCGPLRPRRRAAAAAARPSGQHIRLRGSVALSRSSPLLSADAPRPAAVPPAARNRSRAQRDRQRPAAGSTSGSRAADRPR